MYIVWNVQEAENVGILASLKISHFPFWFPTLKGSIREREGNGKNPFPKFGNGKGMEKIHSRNSGTGREWKNPFPKFGNGKGMKKIHSRNSGTGREWKKSIPEIREGNQRPPFLGMTGNGNSRSPLLLNIETQCLMWLSTPAGFLWFFVWGRQRLWRSQTWTLSRGLAPSSACSSSSLSYALLWLPQKVMLLLLLSNSHFQIKGCLDIPNGMVFFFCSCSPFQSRTLNCRFSCF